MVKGTEAKEFLHWLELIKEFLPKSMSIEEALKIFLRRYEEQRQEKNHGKDSN